MCLTNCSEDQVTQCIKCQVPSCTDITVLILKGLLPMELEQREVRGSYGLRQPVASFLIIGLHVSKN
jgi:hypothetical protein